VSNTTELEKEPWRFDFFTVLRRLERSFPQYPRIGDSASRRDEYVVLGEDPYLDFPASTVGRADRDLRGRIRVLVKFLGLLGPQGALPLATTEEAYSWMLARDDAFPRFLDILNHRFLQLFFRAWADARPIAQHDRPQDDRFETYVGSAIGIGSPIYRNLDAVPDGAKLAFAGLIAPQVKSASRLKNFISGLFGVRTEIDEFVGLRLGLEPGDRTLLGQSHSALGLDMLVGASAFSVQDKIRVRVFAEDLAQYQRFLPSGDACELLADAVFLYIGDQIDWDVELAIAAGAVAPVRLGSFGRLGWTSWMAPNWASDQGVRCDARFHPAERRRHRRKQQKSVTERASDGRHQS
jgi:type VI secretion system protein ImpH